MALRGLGHRLLSRYHIVVVAEERTTVVVERYLNELAGVPGDAPAGPIIRTLLSSSIDQLHLLCATLLYHERTRDAPGAERPARIGP